jgi:hypothetical protein
MSQWSTIIFAIALVLVNREANAQWVTSSAFCLELNERSNRCVRSVPSGSTVVLEALPKREQDRVIYFAATIHSTGKSQVPIVMQREGAKGCGREQVITPVADPTVLSALRDYLSGLSLSDLWGLLGVKEASTAYKDIKISITLTEPSSAFTIWDFRVVSCAGRVIARVVKNDGQAMAGDNDTRVINISSDSTSTTSAPSQIMVAQR